MPTTTRRTKMAKQRRTTYFPTSQSLLCLLP